MLLVVDMQKAFEASENVLDGVLAEVKKAVRNNEWIVFLEYVGEGRTHPALRKVVEGYARKSFVKKDEDDGSYHLIRHLQRRRLIPRNIRVCGVNTNACVKKTVFGLASRIDRKMILLESLVSSGTAYSHNLGLRFMRKLKGLEFVK